MPGYTCALRGCHSKTGGGAALFSFPKDQDVAKLWLEVCGRTDLFSKTVQELRANYKLCEHHFERQYYSSGARKRLLPHAFPTLFPHAPKGAREERELEEAPPTKVLKLKNIKVLSDAIVALAKQQSLPKQNVVAGKMPAGTTDIYGKQEVSRKSAVPQQPAVPQKPTNIPLVSDTDPTSSGSSTSLNTKLAKAASDVQHLTPKNDCEKNILICEEQRFDPLIFAKVSRESEENDVEIESSYVTVKLEDIDSDSPDDVSQNYLENQVTGINQDVFHLLVTGEVHAKLPDPSWGLHIQNRAIPYVMYSRCTELNQIEDVPTVQIKVIVFKDCAVNVYYCEKRAIIDKISTLEELEQLLVFVHNSYT